MIDLQFNFVTGQVIAIYRDGRRVVLDTKGMTLVQIKQRWGKND
jgi:hypothetical protein